VRYRQARYRRVLLKNIMSVSIKTPTKPIGKNLPSKALGERYASSKNSVAIFEVKEKELLVVARLLSVTANGSGEVKGIGNTVYPPGASYVLR
jgi:hypothetical protein